MAVSEDVFLIEERTVSSFLLQDTPLPVLTVR